MRWDVTELVKNLRRMTCRNEIQQRLIACEWSAQGAVTKGDEALLNGNCSCHKSVAQIHLCDYAFIKELAVFLWLTNHAAAHNSAIPTFRWLDVVHLDAVLHTGPILELVPPIYNFADDVCFLPLIIFALSFVLACLRAFRVKLDLLTGEPKNMDRDSENDRIKHRNSSTWCPLGSHDN